MDNVVIIAVIFAATTFILFYSLLKAKAENKKLKDANGSLAKDKDSARIEANGLAIKLQILNNQLVELESERITLSRENKSLTSKYADIIDADAHIEKLHRKADSDIEENKAAIAVVEEEIKDLKKQARDAVSNAKQKADSLFDDASRQRKFIISKAETRAKEIAGEAYEAKENMHKYEAAITAIKNAIKGYGDEYLIPNHTVLDELAEEFSHKEAGEQLAAVRAQIKFAINNDNAAKCDYVEIMRRIYAEHFVIDAFNGKVDSALAKVKHDNYGKIQQEIIDAFASVNHHGQPFRNARITQEYLDLRLNELKWAVRVQELRKIEREEQAAIKAQIREEERAIREMEKARKEAEKEERLIQKALEKARKELAQATEDQREQYESQLSELEGKLKEAEAKGERAMSMAQQTRRGHVYVISNIGSFGEEVFKIGMTRRLEPMDRVKELGDASVPFSFDVHAMIYSDDAPTLEKALHKKFQDSAVNKVNLRKEFFRTDIAEIKATVEEEGITDVHWTLKADAAEHRESLAMSTCNTAEVEVA